MTKQARVFSKTLNMSMYAMKNVTAYFVNAIMCMCKMFMKLAIGLNFIDILCSLVKIITQNKLVLKTQQTACAQ